MRSKEEIIKLIAELKESNENILKNKDKWRDETVPVKLIRENIYRIHTLEWVLGMHDRWD